MTTDAESTALGLEQYTDRILDLLSDGVYISDRDGRTLMVNAMYERLTGLKRADLVGRSVSELTGRGFFDTILNPQIVKTGQPATSVQTDRKGNQFLLNGYPVMAPDGQVALVVTFVRDVTLMAQLKDQIAAQRDIIEKYQTSVEYINAETVHRHPLISESPAMVNLTHFIDQVAATDATVLLQGETGVGKDVFANKIHRLSPRRRRPFVKVDCPTIPESLLESELFGYAPGAFTGARAKGKIGFFEMADKGTLFLDEIGELPTAMQAKLLRVLQDREVVRVGDTQVRKVDVRIISATNRDLEAEVQAGRFRSDLFYRLRVAFATIAPLRERSEDIIPLAGLFLNRYAGRYNKTIRFENGFETFLLGYVWPGNIRELQNLIQTLVITNRSGIIRVSDLQHNIAARHPDASSAGGPGDTKEAVLTGDPGQQIDLQNYLAQEELDLKQIMGALETKLLHQALHQWGSRSKVAKRLGIDRSTLFRKLRDGRLRSIVTPGSEK